ncbi:prolyl oligopeptidase family serine peptidase [Mucilaginibacter sp. HMF5004]|uniref:alpha/beta hydrolase family protein n=1 Tax=Mucilaginibacter rivuli TaxID=2857527 RepID=UPI001C5F275C|nr:prolyl oligopeptidase family serine peptidase [Mucilaginibacter rivuli]MBW4890266.1 prolyl oligopeptidase family serine peptidase [Mucilaginibacter rivuli]
MQTIYLQSLEDSTKKPDVLFSDGGIRDHFWTYDNHVIVPKYDRKKSTFQLFAIDAATMEKRTLLSIGRVNWRVLNRSMKHPDVLTFSMNLRDSTIFDIYRINTKSGELKMYLQNPGNITQYYTDVDGVIRLEKASDGVNETILYRENENSAFKPILRNNFKNQVEPIAFTGTKNYFYARSNVNRDKIALVEINAENGKEERVVYSSDKADIDEVAYSKSKHRLEMVAWQEAKPRRHILNDSIKAIYTDLEKQLPGNEIRIFDRDTSEKHFLINTSNDRNPGSTYLYSMATKKLVKLADMNPGINQGDLCEMKPIQFKAGDGTLINGYLTLPKVSSPQNLPVVVIPHSDFWKRNNWGYNDEVQFLANRGYAVFQVNYRGSTGYGKAFYSAGFQQMGGKMQQDITDGVNWLINQKIANPKKIAIFGTGFGGFSALYGVSFHPGLYNCVAVQGPLINFFTFFKDVQPFLKPKLSMLYEMVGSPETDADRFRAISPVFNAAKIKAPLMIFQGGRDPDAGNPELIRFASEVKKNGTPVTYVAKENKDKEKKPKDAPGGNRLNMYVQLEKFLELNLGKK